MNEFRETFRAKASGSSPLTPLQPDDSFSFLTARALTFWPNLNQNGAAFAEHAFKQTRGLDEVIGTEQGFKFGLVNTDHSVGPGKKNNVLGSVRDEVLIPNVGVDVMAQIDKRACAAFDIGPEEFASNGEYSEVSIEIWCDRDRSTFVAVTNPGSPNLEDQRSFTAEEAAALGIRRTMWIEDQPYLYEGKYVVAELCSPIRCRGVALVPDPADKTANVFEVAASLEKKDSGEENSGFSTADIPLVSPTAADMLNAYTDVEPVDVTASLDALPDNAFADTRVDPGELSSKRSYPLYASAESYANNQPHAGMVKAALQAHADGKMTYPGLALQRLQVAHSQLHGAKSMEEKDKLAAEVASLTAKLTEVQAAQEATATKVSEKDTEIASLQEQVKTLSEEKAKLEQAIEDRNAEEKASTRFGKLTAIEGFAVKDEEKAALLESLKTEDELAFELRVAKATIVSMEEASKKAAEAKKKADEEKAAAEKREEETAALKGLDIVPQAFRENKVAFTDLI